jgi:hypothetical protein
LGGVEHFIRGVREILGGNSKSAHALKQAIQRKLSVLSHETEVIL